MRKRSYQCRHCKKRYVPNDARQMALICAHCGKITSRKTASFSDMRKLTDALFSVIVRYRSADPRGMTSCVTCAKKMHWKEIEAGHFCKRDRWATRYDRRNVNPQCRECNAKHPHDGKPWEHGQWIDRTYVRGTAAKLKELAKSSYKPTKDELASKASQLYHHLNHVLPDEAARIVKQHRAASVEALGI